jgi:hypothetical protein
VGGRPRFSASADGDKTRSRPRLMEIRLGSRNSRLGSRPRLMGGKTRVLEFKTRVSASAVGGRPRFSALADGNKTRVSEFKTRVSASAVGGRPRFSASADGDKPRVSEFKTRVSASADGDKTRVSASVVGGRPRVSASASAVGGIYTPHSQRVSFAPRIFWRNSEAWVSASAEEDICTPHSQIVSFAPKIFCRVTRDFSRNFSFGVATLGIFLHKMRTSASKQNTIHNYNSYKRSQEPEVWQLRGARSW